MGAKACIAKKCIAPGKLELVPVSDSIHCTSTKVPPNVIDFGTMCEVNGKSLVAYVSPMHKKFEPKTHSERGSVEFFAPFWCVQGTSRSEDVNMQFVIKTKTYPGDDWTSGKYNVIVLSNTKALEVGDVLKYYMSADLKEKYPKVENLTAKRARKR